MGDLLIITLPIPGAAAAATAAPQSTGAGPQRFSNSFASAFGHHESHIPACGSSKVIID